MCIFFFGFIYVIQNLSIYVFKFEILAGAEDWVGGQVGNMDVCTFLVAAEGHGLLYRFSGGRGAGLQEVSDAFPFAKRTRMCSQRLIH